MMDSLKWLTVYEMLLCALNAALLVWYALPVARRYRWIDFMPGMGVVIAAVSALTGDTTLLAIAIDAVTAVLFLCTLRRLFKPGDGVAAPRRLIAGTIRAVFCVCGIGVIGVAIQSSGELRYNPTSDWSHLGYAEAFVRLNDRFAVEYPFGEWKKIDWEAKRREYEPIFAQADQVNDRTLYYKTLREYLFSLRDGHVRIANEKLYAGNPIFKAEVGGGFGLSTLQLDDGRVQVTLVLDDSPAGRSGIRLGAEILQWDGQAAKDAYRQTTWTDSPNTNQNETINRGRFMVRAEVGRKVEVEYRNPGAGQAVKTTLQAYDDQFATLKQTKASIVRGAPPVEGKMLSNGYGYVKISSFLANTAEVPKAGLTSLFAGSSAPDPVDLLADCLQSFEAQHAKGVVIDLRDNPGGEDSIVTRMAGHLSKEKKLYGYASYYNRNVKKFSINYGEKYVVQPSKPNYGGNIALLVNGRTASSGEGLPLVLKGQPNVTIVGFTGTNGSFGVQTSPIQVVMPEGYIVESADGRSLNRDHVIQGDGDYTGRGGAVPDVVVPLNEQTFREKYVEGLDVELRYAIEAMEGRVSSPAAAKSQS
ncbi:S41 family peptidase [Paenibacillus cymbidii]|uniref:S41 family peptidase n=1 Tax=Paenibacillus cymbidii TaxID=1639034 RepID=UPI0014369772|nr:S41 family peptidase [Paenibacillus cymbidii]